MKDFFISYRGIDRPWAEWIAWEIEEAGYEVIIQAWDFRPGDDFVLEMHEASEKAERTIAVLSPDYLTSDFTRIQFTSAIAQGKLLPVRVKDYDPKGLLSPIAYIDLVNRDQDAAKDILLAGISGDRAKPKSKPVFPGSVQHTVPKPSGFPGALPPIWNLPNLRNPNFTGRGSLLEDLREALTSGKPAAVTQAIAGLGGVGKTQLATEYAYRYASDYEAVWWVRSEEAASLAFDYADLAGELGLPEKDAAEQKVAVEAVCRWLEQHMGWLLVFDNVPGPVDVRDYIPGERPGTC